MNPTTIHNTYKHVLHLLGEANLSEAISQSRVLCDELRDGGLLDKLNEIELNYNYMLQYFVQGTPDPQRLLMYNRLVASTYLLISELREQLLVRTSANFEYLQKRVFPHTMHFSTISSLTDSLKYHHALPYYDAIQQKNFENLYRDIFSVFWLKTNFTHSERELFKMLVSEQYVGKSEKMLAVTALTLNIWRMFDEDKIQMLIDCCNNSDVEIKQRGLVGLCFILARFNRFIPYFPQIRNRVLILANDTATATNFKNIIVQIIATLDTEKITKRLRDEILPEIMKLSPQIKEKFEADNLLKSEEWEESNPEWQELLEQSGVKEKIEELNELQLEGADVYMGTFAMLKSFSFFSEISNWFLPFDANHTAIKSLFEANDSHLLTAFVKNNMLCNSDKYSFCLSILQMPETQRNSIKNGFKIESEQLAEMTRDQELLAPDVFSKNISKQYIQDLYRFFKLFPNSSGFSNMFASALFMHQTLLFDILSAASDVKNYVAEFYFAKSHYKQAISLFRELVDEQEPNATVFQKIGYCYQQTSDIKSALEAYQKADIILPDDVWTLKKIALCYKLIGDYNNALKYYLHVKFLKPTNLSNKLQIANCYVELKQYSNALAYYDELEKQEQGNLRIQRAIVWCSLLSMNLPKADFYLQTIIEEQPEFSDYLNLAYVKWLNKDMLAAVSAIRAAKSMSNMNQQLIFERIQQDAGMLKNAGIVLSDVYLMLESLRKNLI